MANLNATPGTDAATAGWLHWLFVQQNRAVSCSLDVRSDGVYIATLVPLWSPTDQIMEVFRRPADAIRWQEAMRHRLQAAGWLLVEGGLVTHAA